MVERPDWLGFRRLAAVTTALTLSLITLGVYTAATGSGLACQAQWPLCSNQLIPALTINPDFIEWFHRVVAMITGLFILATALWAWRRGGASVRPAVLAVLLLPLQISIGAVTVTVNGLIPWGYQAPTHAAHLLVALSIFTLLVATTLLAGRGDRWRRRLRWSQFSFVTALFALLVSGLFSRGVPLLRYSPGAQAWFYAFSLVAFAALLAAFYWTAHTDRLSRVLAGGALGTLFVSMLLGRDLVVYTVAVQRLNFALYVLTVGLVAVGCWRLFTAETAADIRTLRREHSE